MDSNNQTTKLGGVPDAPLQLFQPMNIIIFLSFFSPIILAVSITSLSFIFQNFKGLIYLGFLIAACVVRNYVYMMSGSAPVQATEQYVLQFNIVNMVIRHLVLLFLPLL